MTWQEVGFQMLESLARTTCDTTIYAGFSLAYAKIAERNPTLVVQAAVVKAIYNHAAINIPALPFLRNHQELACKVRNAACLIGDVTAIVAFRHLNIIANRRTIAFGALTFMHTSILLLAVEGSPWEALRIRW